MPKPIHVLNGPNLDLLGVREPAVYGTETLDGLKRRCETRATALGLAIVFRQSNSEGTLVDWIHEAREGAAGLVVNAAAYSHTSIAILDALQALEIPIVEVHLSNIMRREPFRRRSYVSLAARGMICGLGGMGYELAIEALATMIEAGARGKA